MSPVLLDLSRKKFQGILFDEVSALVAYRKLDLMYILGKCRFQSRDNTPEAIISYDRTLRSFSAMVLVRDPLHMTLSRRPAPRFRNLENNVCSNAG